MNTIQVLLVCITILTVVNSVSSFSPNTSLPRIGFPGYGTATLVRDWEPHEYSIAGCSDRERNKYIHPSGKLSPCEIVNRDGRHCNLTFDNGEAYWLMSLYRLNESKILVHTEKYGDGTIYLTLVDMSRCTQIYKVVISHLTSQIVPYADGTFDVLGYTVTSGWHLKRFDAFGKPFHTLNITFDVTNRLLEPLSSKSRDRGFFVRGDNHDEGRSKYLTKVKFVDQGSQARDVLKLDTTDSSLTSRVDRERYYVICGKNEQRYSLTECTRFDLLTNQTLKTKYRDRKSDSIEMMDERASDNGIVVLLKTRVEPMEPSWTVVEMRPNEVPKVQEYRSPSDSVKIDNCEVGYFNVTDKSFVLACKRLTADKLQFYELVESNMLRRIESTNEAVNQKQLSFLHNIFITLTVGMFHLFVK